MNQIEKNTNKKVLLLNSFVNKCTKCKMQDNYRVNGHLFSDTPIGILSIHTYISKTLPDVKTEILDAEQLLYINAWRGMDYCWELFTEKLKKVNPQVIGLSQSYYHGSRLFHETVKRIKEILPESVIVAGGNYPTDATDIVLEDPNVDYVIKSEGEVTFTEFVKRYFAIRTKLLIFQKKR